MNKKELSILGIEDTKQTFWNNIAIFKTNSQVLLFNILWQDNYEIHSVSTIDFINHVKNEDTNKQWPTLLTSDVDW